MIRQSLLWSFALAGCLDSGSDCVPGAPNSVCFVAEDGTVVDHSAEVARGTVAEPVLLSLGSGHLTFGPGTFRINLAVEGKLVLDGAGDVETVLAGARAERPTELYGSVIALVGDGSSIDVSNVAIEDGVALAGGGISSELPTQSVTVRRAKLRDNLANGSTNWGGAIFAAGTLVVEDSGFEGNRGHQGGAIYAGGASTRIVGSRLTENSATEGGAIFTYTDALELRDTEIVFNGASYGGGLVLAGPGIAGVENTVFRDNHAFEAGGVMLSGGTATFTKVDVDGNTAQRGAGMFVFDGDANIIDGSLHGNQAFAANESSVGGALLVVDGRVLATRVDIAGNRAGHAGGGVALTRQSKGSSLVSDHCGFSSNEGPGPGAPAIANLQIDGTFAPGANASFRCDLDGCR